MMHPRIELVGGLALALFEAAAASARAAARAGRLVFPRRKRGLILSPGPGTPLWNVLLTRAAPHLRKRGSKAQLARMLGLPRQRLQDCLKARSACLDAERTLMLLCWLARRSRAASCWPDPDRGRCSAASSPRRRLFVIHCVTKSGAALRARL